MSNYEWLTLAVATLSLATSTAVGIFALRQGGRKIVVMARGGLNPMRSLSDPHLRVLNTGGRAVQIVAVDLYLLRHDLSRYPLPRSWRYERLHLPWQHANLMGYPVKDMHQRLSFPFTIEPGFAFAFCAEGEHGYEAMRDLLRGTRKLLPGVELADGRVVFGRRWSAGG